MRPDCEPPPDPTRRDLFGVPGPLRWQRPERPDSNAFDALEVACAGPGVLLRSTLGGAVTASGGAWTDFVRAVKRGEYDHTADPGDDSP